MLNYKYQTLAFSILLLFIMSGCGPTSEHDVFFEPEIDQRDVDVNRVAIVPNRLPLMLDQQEMWRRRNWETAKNEFEERGFDVVDYETSVDVFQQSGLPVDDTPQSRDKLLDYSEELGVDLIFVPYYGTMFNNRNFLIFNVNNFRTVTTFQIYSAQKEEFVSRIDATGEYTVRTGLGALLVVGVSFFGAGADADIDTETQETIGSIGLAISVIDLIRLLIPPENRWATAFQFSITAGLDPFFAVYPSPTR